MGDVQVRRSSLGAGVQVAPPRGRLVDPIGCSAATGAGLGLGAKLGLGVDPSGGWCGQMITSTGWLDSARGCAFSAEGTRHPDHTCNQDALILWQGFGGHSGSVLCAVMDGHGPHGALIAQAIQSSLPVLLSEKLPLAPDPEECCDGDDAGSLPSPESSYRSERLEGSWCECSSEASSPDRSSSSAEGEGGMEGAGVSAPELADMDDSKLAGLWAPRCDDVAFLLPWLGAEVKASERVGPAELQRPCALAVPSPPDDGGPPMVVPPEVLEEAFEEMDKGVRENRDIFPLCSGSTAVVALLTGTQLTVAHVGDSRCVLGMEGANGGLEAIQLTVDHTPSEISERRRVEVGGGRVLALRQEPEVARVWLPDDNVPGLALTRSIGDELLKGCGVICTPEILRVTLDESARFIVLGSEGLWNVMLNADVVRTVSGCCDRVQAAERLTMAAKRRWMKTHGPGRIDDITAVVYFLTPLTVSVKAS